MLVFLRKAGETIEIGEGAELVILKLIRAHAVYARLDLEIGGRVLIHNVPMGHTIYIDGGIEIKLIKHVSANPNGAAKIGIQAPIEVAVHRGEVAKDIRDGKARESWHCSK